MIRYLIAAVALVCAAPATPQSLTLGNLKGPIAERSGQPPAGSIKELWSQIYAIPPKAAPSVELPKIPSNFDTAALLIPAWGSGKVAPSGKPDVVGAFRFSCRPSHLSYDDPIVYPGQPGASHLHQFFGNTLANGNSTYASLRTTGESTCSNILNRSAYWMPAMMDGKGGVVIPDWMSVYYKRRPASDSECQRMAKACVQLPRGLRFVFGYDMQDPGAVPAYALWFNCDGPTAKSGHFKDIVEAAVGCPAGNRLGATINAPECWNGKDLDSPDHRSHMAYARYFPDSGLPRCPATHPYVVPTFTLSAWYTVDDNLDRSGTWSEARPTWYLSSDRMPGMKPMRPGSTFHSDWFGAWDDDTLDTWTANCIDKLLDCTAGDLGNGRQLRGGELAVARADPHVVPVPAR